MDKAIRISVSKKPLKKATLNAKETSIRERILRSFLGPTRKVLILVPGEDVTEVTIVKKGEH